MNELVSVIVPVYNSENKLRKCLDSIIFQKYKNIEIIVINDGSTDSSLEIINEYSKRDKRIVNINIENNGVSNARNVGIKNSTGKYILFVDSDDWISDNMIEIIMRNSRNKNILKICGYSVFDDNNILSKNNNIKRGLYNLKNDFEYLFFEKNLLKSPWCKLYNSEIIKKNNIMFDVKINLGEDILFNLQYLKNIDFVEYCESDLYHYYRGNTDSLSLKYNNNMLYIQKNIYAKIKEFITIKNCVNKKNILKSSLKMLLSSISNEFKSGDNIFKKYYKARNILKDEEICNYIRDLYEIKVITKFEWVVLKNRWILIYFLIKKI